MNLDEVLERELESLQGRVETRSGGIAGRLRKSRPALIILALSVVFLQLRGLPEEFSSTTLNAAAILQARTASRHVQLVTINNDDYWKMFGGVSPLNPVVLAQVLKAIAGGRPALIVVDLETSHPMFQSLLAPENTRMIWAVPNEDVGNETFAPAKALGGREPLPATWSTALALVPNDERGIVRSYWRRFPIKKGGTIPSLEFAAGQAYKGLPMQEGTIRPSQNVRLFDFRYQITPVSAGSVLEFSKLPGWGNGILRDKVVVLGGTYPAARNRYATPVRAMDGAEIAAQGIEAEIENTGISPANPWLAGLLQLLAGLGIVAVYRRFRLRTALLISLLLIPLLSVVTSLLLFHRIALWAALIPVLLAVLIAEMYAKASLYLALCTKLKTLGHKEAP